MSYVALYRKFRPNDFKDVKGQDHIVTALKNQLATNRIGHAYLFSGTRGTGKTTIAKIFAKAVNCENPTENGPCNECEICRSINRQTSLNVSEIDAASNNGVDNIRQIVDEVQYSPTEGKYKVYIIDEVHMLSQGAFNALLKTLEEPPSYVIFILATTEAHKIPITILSRCQRYEFKRMQVGTIVERLHELMEKENIDADEKAIKYIAKCADGAMRDALSLLDQCISFHVGEKLTYDSVLEILGAVDIDMFSRMLTCIINGEVTKGIKLIENVILEGKDLNQFVINFTWFLRNIMLIKTTENTLELVDVTEEKLMDLRKIAVEVSVEVVMRYISIFSELSNKLKYATQKRVLVEAAFIKLCKPQMEDNNEALLNRIEELERKIDKGVFVPNKADTNISDKFIVDDDEEHKLDDIQDIEQVKELVKAVPEEIKELAKGWQQVVNKTPISFRGCLKMATPCVGEDGVLTLVFTDDFAYSSISREVHLVEIKNIIISLINKEVTIRTQLKDSSGSQNDSLVDITKLIKTDVTFVD